MIYLFLFFAWLFVGSLLLEDWDRLRKWWHARRAAVVAWNAAWECWQVGKSEWAWVGEEFYRCGDDASAGDWRGIADRLARIREGVSL